MIKNRRRGLSDIERKSKEDRIRMHLMHRIGECAAESLMAYLAFDGEVDLAPMLDDFEAQGGVIYLPRVRDKKCGIMDTIRMPYPWRDHIVTGAYGLSEPNSALPMSDTQAPRVILVPGVAFDLSGARIGFGGGYYDRFLSQVSTTALRIGVAFDLQIVDMLVCDDHDVRVQEVCTESGCQPVSEQCVSTS